MSARIVTFSLASLVSAGVLPGIAAAAETEAATLSEVVVTADKRGEESIQSIPTTIQAISGDTLDRKGAVEFADFSGQVAGLTYDDLGPGDKKYVIRGVTSTGPATVGVYYDEAVITGSNSNDGGGREPDIRLFDLDRIEVLKGPQGTLYGASSMSGTIRYITKKPVLDKVEGYVQGEGSNTTKGGGNYGINGALNLPIVQGALALRLVGWDVQNSGYIDDVRIPAGPVNNANWDKTEGGRALLRWAANEQLDIVASATVQTLKSGGSARYTPEGALSFGDTPEHPAPQYPRIPGGDLTNTDVTLSPWDETMEIFGVTGTYTLPVGVITATSNYFDRRIDFNFDSTPILISFDVPVQAITHQPQDRRVVSNEIRYASKLDSPVNFVVGGFSQLEHNDFTVQVIKSNNLGLPNGPFSGLNSDDALSNPDGNSFFGRYDNNIIKQYAAFGEVTWAATDRLTALVGLRYFHSSQESFQAQTHPFGGFTGSPVGEQTNSFAGNKTTFKANLSYKTDFGLVYATVSEGFRVGGTNAADLPFASNIPRTYSPDQLRNYELGIKSDFLDKRLRVNAAAYAIRWSNIQLQTVDSTGAFPFVANGGTASVDGFEIESQMLLASGLELDLTGTYENARLTADQPNECFKADGVTPCNPNVAYSGDNLPEVPKFMANAALSYSVPVSDAVTANFRGDLQYRDATNSQTNARSIYNVPLAPYTLLNLRAGVDWNEWNATVFVKNVTDKRAQVDAISSSQDPLALLTVRPRTVGLQVTRKF